MKIAIIGAGNMGGAIACGLLKHNAVSAENLIVADIVQANLDAITATDSAVQTVTDAKKAAQQADLVILAVKPWLVQPVLSDLTDFLTEEKILVSIAAGVDFAYLYNITKKSLATFRVMPNTAVAKGESMTLVASENASKQQESVVLQFFGSLGKAVLIEEKLMGAATSVASCGIAYALRYLRAAVEGAIELGFRADVATEIVAQTMKGAVSLVESGAHPEAEIDRVCTPGGWTIKGLNEMEANGFTNAVIKGLKIND